jgi:hypothetical protein
LTDPANPVPKVYAFCNLRYPEGGDQVWVAIADDGEVMAQHMSSSRNFGQRDVHLNFSSRRAKYEAKFGGIGEEFYEFVVLPEGELPPAEVLAKHDARYPDVTQ